MKKIAWTLIYLASAVVSFSTCMDPRTIPGAPVIDLGYAQYQGVFDSVNNITSYLGIRYAAPPIG